MSKKHVKTLFFSIAAFLSCISLSAKISSNTETEKAQIKCNNNIPDTDFIKNVFNDKKFSIVRIISVANKTESSVDDPPNDKQIISGTGVFVSDHAYIITSASLVKDTDNTWIEHNGLTYSAECVGVDKATNIAVIRPLQMPAKFDFVDIVSDVSETTLPDIGEFAIFIGCKFELDPSADLGIISGKHISYGDFTFLTTYLRSTLEFVGGESGSPVFNPNGDLIGVMIAALPELKSSFILPKRAINRIYKDITENGKVQYGAIGIEIRAEYKLGLGQQIIISRVTPESSANKCGLQSGDVILKMNSFAVSHREDVHNALFFSKPDSTMHLEIMRGERTLHLDCKIEASTKQ